MRYVWLAIIGLTLVPVAFVSFLLNPLTLWVLGPDAWRERVLQLRPYRWWFTAAVAILCVATFAYARQYGL